MPDIQIKEELTEDLPIRIRLSPQGIANLAKAMAAARPNFGVVKKSAENPFYKDAKGKSRKYADLTEIITATDEALAEQGLSVIQAPSINNGERSVGMTTLLIHESGEWLETIVLGCPADQKIKDKNGDLTISRFDAQTVGIGFTYMARYTERALLNLGAEDDDGNGLVQPPKEPAKALNAYKEAVKPVPQPLRISESFTTGKPPASPESPESELKTTDTDGCPVNDEDVPAELKLPNKEQLASLVERLKALGEDRRLCRQWLEVQAGKEYKQVPKVLFEKILGQLESAKKENKLNDLIAPKKD